MRAVAVYLIVYGALVVGALIALWSGGVLGRLPLIPVVAALVIAAAFGLLLAYTTRGKGAVADGASDDQPGNTAR